VYCDEWVCAFYFFLATIYFKCVQHSIADAGEVKATRTRRETGQLSPLSPAPGHVPCSLAYAAAAAAAASSSGPLSIVIV